MADRAYGGLVIACVIALALVGMMQSLGVLADAGPLEPTWRSEAAADDECDSGRSSPSPEATGPAAIRPPGRGAPTLDVVDQTTPSASSIRLPSRDSRAPPALLAHPSVR
jgi:hypothetical protein